MGASRWQPLPVLTWMARRAGGADAVGVVRGLLVALDHRQRQLGVLLQQARMVAHSSVVLPSRGWRRG